MELLVSKILNANATTNSLQNPQGQCNYYQSAISLRHMQVLTVTQILKANATTSSLPNPQGQCNYYQSAESWWLMQLLPVFLRLKTIEITTSLLIHRANEIQPFVHTLNANRITTSKTMLLIPVCKFLKANAIATSLQAVNRCGLIRFYQSAARL